MCGVLMVLEEEIYFSSQDTAKEFVKLLKGAGVSSQMRQKASLDIRLMLTGTYTNLMPMLESLISDGENTEEEIELFTLTRDHLTSERDLIASSLEKYQIGEKIGSGVMDLITGDRTIEGDEGEDVLEEIIEEIYLTRLLHLNDLLEMTESGLVLSKKINADECTLSIFADEIPMIPDETLAKYQVKSTITAGDDVEWQVTVGTEFVFLEDLTEIGEFLEENEISEEEGASFFPRIQIKHMLVAEILEMIKDEGKATREEIITEFADRDIETKDDDAAVSLHLSPFFIDSVIDDLKKAGVLKGKDQKLRIAF